jgi:Flp pilus assembly protein TadB
MQIAEANEKAEQQRGQRANEPPEARPAGIGEERCEPEDAREQSLCAASPRRFGLRAWLIGSAVFVALVAYAGWDWLVATGVATVLVAVGPCLLMCALGLCMRHGKSKGDTTPAEVGNGR